MHTEQFITERTYLKGVSPRTVDWYRSSFKAFDGALNSKQAVVSRIALLRRTNSAISVNTSGASTRTSGGSTKNTRLS